jgi:Toprim domain-containing protein
MFDLRHAAIALGGEVNGREVLCPGPNHSPKDRSLSVRFDPAAPGGFIVWSFAGDDPIAAKDYIRQRLGLPEWQPGDEQDRRIYPSRVRAFDKAAIEHDIGQRPRTEDDLERIAMATRLWQEASALRSATVDRYFNSRALDLPDVTALRFHPRCPWRDENAGVTIRIPALIGAFASIDDDLLTAVHRVRLDQPQCWPKADRRMLGIVHRAAIKLDAIDGDSLVIGEGIETCLAARQLGYRPVWALGSVGAISFFPVLEGIRRLLILGETGKASAEAIQFCGRRWQRAGRRVQIVMPDVGSDLNDQLMMRRV